MIEIGPELAKTLQFTVGAILGTVCFVAFFYFLSKAN